MLVMDNSVIAGIFTERDYCRKVILKGKNSNNIMVDELMSEAAVDRHTADNLILWCSLASGESSFTTSALTSHTRTAMELARLFTGVEFKVEEESRGRIRIGCEGIGLKHGQV